MLSLQPTVLELFRRIMEDRDIADAREGPNADLRKLIEYVLRKFFKAVQEHPFLLLEVRRPALSHSQGEDLTEPSAVLLPQDADATRQDAHGRGRPVRRQRRRHAHVQGAFLPLLPRASHKLTKLLQQAKKIGEVEVQPGFSHTQQIGIAIACLLEGGEQRLVDMVKKVRTRFLLSS